MKCLKFILQLTLLLLFGLQSQAQFTGKPQWITPGSQAQTENQDIIAAKPKKSRNDKLKAEITFPQEMKGNCNREGRNQH